MYPLVSVVMPAYDRAAVLQRAVESVCNQTYKNWELIICDDASRDNTAEVAEGLRGQDRRIQLLRHSRNLGAAEARNTSMRSAKGKYIAFLDSDDEWLPDKLARQVDVMEGLPDRVGICCTGAKYLINGIRCTKVIPEKAWEENTLEKLIDGTMVYATSSILFRRACLESTGMMTPALRRGQDDDWLVRFCLQFGLKTIQDILVRMHLCTLQKRICSHTIVKADYMVSTYYHTIERTHGRRCAALFKGKLLMEVAGAAFREHRYGCAMRYLVRAVRCSPLQRKGVYIRLLRSLLHGLWHWR